MALTTEQIEEARIAVFKAHGADLIPEVATTTPQPPTGGFLFGECHEHHS